MKTDFRRLMTEKRNNLSGADRASISKDINKKLTELKQVSSAKCIFAYCAFGSEVDLIQLFEYCKSCSISIALPRITGCGIMEAAKYTGGSLKKNIYGIYEPCGTDAADKDSIDTVIVPAVVFDKELYRLGYGGGYYDRFLCGMDAVKIGVCFDIQIVDYLPREQHDIKMDIVVSEKRTLGAVL